MTIDYNEKLAQEISSMGDKVRRHMLPLVARNPALDKATREYAEAQAELYGSRRSEALAAGRSPNNVPIPYRNNALLDRCADLVLHEELTWSHADKMSIVEYPVMSADQELLRKEKYTPHSDLQYGDRRYTGRRKMHFTDDNGSPQVRNSRVVDPHDPLIEQVNEYIDLHRALDGAGLTARQRQAIDLVYFEDLTQKAAAADMGVSQPAVAKFERQALAKLREYMTKE